MSTSQLKQEEAQLRQMIEQSRKEARDTTLKDVCQDLEPLPRTNLKVRKTLKGHNGKVYAMHWSQDNRNLVSTAQDGRLIVWNAVMGLKQASIKLRSTWVMTCAYSPSGKLVASGGLDNICSIYDISNPDVQPDRPIAELSAHVGYISCCRFLSDQKMLTSSGDLSCGLWDTERQTMVSRFTGHNGDVMSLAVSPNGQQFVSGACDSNAKLWDMRTGRCCQTFSGHDSDINSVAFFPDGNGFGSASDDTTCQLFDIRADQQVNIFSLPRGGAQGNRAMTSVGFSKSGRMIFGGCEDYNVYTWDTLKGESCGVLGAHEQRVSCLGVSDNGFAICTGSWDSTLRIWT
eukprot:m.22691 g.22691  ORF g.22691 m.22691 type:complete len:345 (+) comp7427_c0_seq1:250-1284(+)